jgi:hypothetical protein
MTIDPEHISEAKKIRLEKPKYHCRVAKQVPQGTLSLSRFAIMHCITQKMMRRYVNVGIEQECINVTEISLRNHIHRYLTPEQQKAAREFFDKYGIQYLRF